MRLHSPWKVPTHMPRVLIGSIAEMRVSISFAALFVNVTASSPCGLTCPVWMSHAMRVVSTRVLPLPAPARISADWPGNVTASSCCSFRPARKWGDMRTGVRRHADCNAQRCCPAERSGLRGVLLRLREAELLQALGEHARLDRVGAASRCALRSGRRRARAISAGKPESRSLSRCAFALRSSADGRHGDRRPFRRAGIAPVRGSISVSADHSRICCGGDDADGGAAWPLRGAM